MRSRTSAEPSSSHDAHPAVQHTAMSHQTPGWAEKLKGQTILEDTMAGRPERAAMVERQHERIMLQMQQDLQTQTADGFLSVDPFGRVQILLAIFVLGQGEPSAASSASVTCPSACGSTCRITLSDPPPAGK